MSREIKFRVWDELSAGKANSKMRYFGLFDSDSIHMLGEDTYSMPLMQYTGLKDKNGKEIYEGDIVEIDHDKYATFMWGPKIVKYTEDAEWSPFDPSDERGSPAKEYIIIGNIYENPELLSTPNPKEYV